MNPVIDPARLTTAFLLLFVYAWICMTSLQAYRRKSSAVSNDSSPDGAAWTVVFASQTGTAEDLGRQTADTLRLAGVSVRLKNLSGIEVDDLRNAGRVLFVASTYGEGDAPDDAAAFAGQLMTSALPLGHLHYAVLALGDGSYANFCGFGRALDDWLRRQGAQPLFERIEVDRGNSAAIETWRQQLSHLAGTSDAPDWSGPEFSDWRLAERRLLNAGSAGAAVYHVELEPVGAALPEWQSGDLVQIVAPADMEKPREYSIASIPEDGRIHLLIRLHHHADGTCGLVSGWMLLEAAIGDMVRMRLRRHDRFRLEDNPDRPLILIGNGTGIAGLRGHLRARMRDGAAANWLIFGERNAASDFHYRNEIESWRASGSLRLDMVFSRDQAQRRYVQHRLLEAGDMLRDWVRQGAAIYVCGSLKGMAAGVDQALTELLGRPMLEQLSTAGRYRRDVY